MSGDLQLRDIMNEDTARAIENTMSTPASRAKEQNMASDYEQKRDALARAILALKSTSEYDQADTALAFLGITPESETPTLAVAHEYLRHALKLPDDAPYRFDYYAQLIEQADAEWEKRGIERNPRCCGAMEAAGWNCGSLERRVFHVFASKAEADTHHQGTKAICHDWYCVEPIYRAAGPVPCACDGMRNTIQELKEDLFKAIDASAKILAERDEARAALSASPQPAQGVPEDHKTAIQNARDEGANFVIEALAKAVNAKDWHSCDGTETWDGDVSGTVWNVLCAAGVIDADTGQLRSQPAQRVPEGSLATFAADLSAWKDNHHDCDCPPHDSCGCKELSEIILAMDISASAPSAAPKGE